MNLSAHRLLGSLLLIIGGLALSASARAADALITYQLPSADTSGIAAQIAPGVTGCISGCATLRIPRGAAVAARRQAMLSFSAPAGTTIVNAAIRLRYRTKQPTVSAHLQSRVGGRWLDGQRLRSVGGTAATVSAGRGASAVAVTLTADGAVPARAVKSDAENSVTVETVQLTVRDVAAPTVEWSTPPPASDAWTRGALCGTFAARDAGLGVDHVDFSIGGVSTTAAAAGGTRLQPRPLAFDGTACLETALVGDGTFGTSLTAVDANAAGNRSTALTGVVRIDNTAPVVTYRAPADPEARLPQAQLQITDAASGVERITASIDGLPAQLQTLGALTTVQPMVPLTDGTHRLAWEAADAAGNVSSGSETIGVLDVTAPAIDDAQPQGLVGPLTPVTAHAIDTGAGLALDGWRLAIDGVDVTGAAELSPSGTITYLPSRPWPEGEHTVRATAVDRSGNRTVRTWSFALPVTPPPAPVSAVPMVPAETSVSTDATPPETTGPSAGTQITPRLTLRPSLRTTRVGGRVLLRGALAGLQADRVVLEARVGRRWRAVARVALSARGTFATPVRLPQAGGYDVRARVAGTVSRTVHLLAH